MRSVKDTFIVERTNTEASLTKIFSLQYGNTRIGQDEFEEETLLNDSELKDYNNISGIVALACLVYKYTNQEDFTIMYKTDLIRNLSFSINEKTEVDSIKTYVEECLNVKRNDVIVRKNVIDIIIDFSGSMEASYYSKSNMVFDIQVDENNRSRVSFRYKKSIYSKEYTVQLGAHWLKINEQINSTSMRVGEIYLLSEKEISAELDQIRDKFSYDDNYNYSIIDIYNKNIKEHFKEVAICDMQGEMTYEEVELYSNKIANLLQSNEISQGDIVAIIGERSRQMILAILGILKLGAVYVPIDIENPIARTTYILEDILPKRVIVLENVKELADLNNLLFLDDINNYPKEFQCAPVEPSNYAYILYTSGTTGEPKGVIIRHSSIVNLNNWFSKTYDLTENKNILHMTNISFDVSVEETIISILNFATIHIIPQSIKLDKEAFHEYMVKNNINIAQFVPVTMNELIMDVEKIESLRVIICGGEKLDDNLKNKIIGKGYRLFNHYGPTEFTVDAIACECQKDTNYLGRLIDNNEAYILDENGRLEPYGAVGELCLSGVGISEGYFNKAEITKEKFIWSELLKRKIYKTGDFGVMLQDGNIIFEGRKDHQVKINGLRIELEEIKTYFQKYTKISDVVIVKHDFYEQALCIFYKSNNTILLEDVKKYLDKYLPQYMIPKFFIKLQEWPVTSNGKINEKKLQQWEISHNYGYIAPRNKMEKEISHIWKRVLRMDKISIDSEFKDIGGGSLNVAILANEILKHYKVRLPLNVVFSSTIESMASQVVDVEFEKTIIDDQNFILLKKSKHSDKNLFFIHGGNGEAEVFMNLCNNMSANYNMWGIRADRLENYAPKNITLESIAQKYASKIESIQKQGPYYLIGWCIGGSVAFETALQLERRGKALGFFGMINSFAPDREFWGEIPDFSVQTEKEALGDFPEQALFKQIYAKEKFHSIKEVWLQLLDFYEKNNLSVAELKNYVYDDMDRAIPNFDADNITIQEIIYYINVLRTFDNVRALYKPDKKLKAKCDFFLATEEQAANASLWNEYCEQPISTHKVEGNNFSIFRYPQVHNFSIMLDELLIK